MGRSSDGEEDYYSGIENDSGTNSQNTSAETQAGLSLTFGHRTHGTEHE